MKALTRCTVACTMTLALSACSTTTWQTDKYVMPNYSGAPKNIYVVMSLSDDAQAIDKPTFDAALHDLLQSCTIASKNAIAKASYVKSDEATLDLAAVNADIKDDQPDAVLLLVEQGKADWENKLTLKQRDIGRWYVASLTDVPAKATVWKSNIYLTSTNGVTSYQPAELGQAMARDIVGYLVGDNIIRSCPSGVAAQSLGSPTTKSEPSPEVPAYNPLQPFR